MQIFELKYRIISNLSRLFKLKQTQSITNSYEGWD